MQERTIALPFHVYYHRGGTFKHFPLYSVLLLSIDSSLVISFQRWHVSLHEFSPTLLSILSFLAS